MASGPFLSKEHRSRALALYEPMSTAIMGAESMIPTIAPTMSSARLRNEFVIVEILRSSVPKTGIPESSEGANRDKNPKGCWQ